MFDEIDAGVGGQTAHAVGETLRRLSTRAQVVTITHLPQIASLAAVRPLQGRERADELARMLGGEEAAAAARDHAEAMLLEAEASEA